MTEKKILEIKESGNEIWIPCESCNQKTCHRVLFGLATKDQLEIDDDYWIDAWDDYHVVQCLGCNSISFFQESFDETDIHGPEDYDISKTQRFYPSRIVGRPRMHNWHKMPSNVARIYFESHKALCNEMNILAGIGIRSIVEAVCREQNTAAHTLNDSIDKLHSMGLITFAGSKILHSLRFMGNAAAHDVKAHSNEELNTAFDVIEYLLKGVYLLPEQAKNLPNK